MTNAASNGAQTDALTKALQVNYSDVGAALIEKLYAEDFLSLSGAAGTDRLVTASGVAVGETEPGAHILDIGCGLGGPAMRLARDHRLRVTGIDLVDTVVATARERVAAAGLDQRIEIRQGDATALTFADASFDAVFSQDALCHVPNKAAALSEAARVAKPGAAIAFTDWVETGPMPDALRAAALEALCAANLQTRAGYEALLAGVGYRVTVSDDISAAFTATYEQVMSRLEAMETEISERFSPRVYGIMVARNESIRRAFADRALGGCLIAATPD